MSYAPAAEEVRRRLNHGLIPAVPVPLAADGEIDARAQQRYVNYMSGQPAAGVAVWAHTGRGLHLAREQRLQVLESWSKGLGAGKVVIAGVGGSPAGASNYPAYVDSALAMARDALGGGAHALLVHPPTALRSSDRMEELVFDYHRQLAAPGAPLILFYLYEAAGGISYPPHLLRQLLALPEVIGIKVATLDSVMTFQNLARLMAEEFSQKLLITGEDRFLGYSLMCGAQAALIGMAAACTPLQHSLMSAYYQHRAPEFISLTPAVDRLSQALFVPPMEGYIRRILWALVHLGVLDLQSAHDPWGPALPETEFVAIGNTLRLLDELSGTTSDWKA